MSPDYLLPAAIVFALIGALLLVGSVTALLRRQPLRSTLRLLTGLLGLSMGTLLALLGVGIQGYRALTHEEVAARIRVTPMAPQRFTAEVTFADGRRASFEIAGDQLYVDAHILKWKPWANVMGLHTAYELSRIAGRYQSLDQERAALRTVHTLQRDHPVDLFSLRRRYAQLSPLLDAEYGSASFVPAAGARELELRVSTGGLLLREAK